MKNENDRDECSACELFRGRLERALGNASEAPAPSAIGQNARNLSVLGWQEHLFECEECRQLLAKEEALEVLLEVLPKVALPGRLAKRVLARLAADRTEDLSRIPESALDRVLDRDAIPAPPAGLAARVLASLESERARPTELIRLPQRWAFAAAALALFAVGSWILVDWKPDPEGQSEEQAELVDLDVDPALLASLEVLENWELLFPEDVDVLLGGLASAGDLAAGLEPFGTELEEGR